MNLDKLNDIRRNGFAGFVAISRLRASDCCEVPKEPGIYLVLTSQKTRPRFVTPSTGGHFKGKDPNVGTSELRKKWPEGARVLYIGKAGPKHTLRGRLKQYMAFGQCAPVGHWGGRYIWQLRGSQNLTVCWKPTVRGGDPRAEEKRLIEQFMNTHNGKCPFANLVR